MKLFWFAIILCWLSVLVAGLSDSRPAAITIAVVGCLLLVFAVGRGITGSEPYHRAREAIKELRKES